MCKLNFISSLFLKILRRVRISCLELRCFPTTSISPLFFRRAVVYVWLSFFLTIIVSSPGTGVAESLDRIIASIDGEPIAASEVKQALARYDEGAAMLAGGVLSPESIKMGMIGLLLDREASSLNISVLDSEVEKYIDTVRQSNKLSVEAFEASIKESGYTLEQYATKLRARLLKNRVLSTALRSQVQVTNEEVARYLGEEDESQLDGFTLISVTGEKQIVSDFLERADLKDVLRGGCSDLKDVIGLNCVNLGVFKEEELRDDIALTVSGLEMFEPSEVIADSTSYLAYIRVPPISNKDLQSYREVKERLFQERFMEAAEQYLEKDLFSKYSVEMY